MSTFDGGGGRPACNDVGVFELLPDVERWFRPVGGLAALLMGLCLGTVVEMGVALRDTGARPGFGPESAWRVKLFILDRLPPRSFQLCTPDNLALLKVRIDEGKRKRSCAVIFAIAKTVAFITEEFKDRQHH